MREESWIPRLGQLPDFHLIELAPGTLGSIHVQVWEVPQSFVPRWITLHHRDQGLAEDHWERYVERILGDAAAVGKHHDRSTMRRAVTAAITLLEHPIMHGTCLIGRAEDHCVLIDPDARRQTEGSPR